MRSEILISIHIISLWDLFKIFSKPKSPDSKNRFREVVIWFCTQKNWFREAIMQFWIRKK